MSRPSFSLRHVNTASNDEYIEMILVLSKIQAKIWVRIEMLTQASHLPTCHGGLLSQDLKNYLYLQIPTAQNIVQVQFLYHLPCE